MYCSAIPKLICYALDAWPLGGVIFWLRERSQYVLGGRASAASGEPQGQVIPGWEFARSVLILHKRFSPRLGEKPHEINGGRGTLTPLI
jgi:hypothetical protein